MRALNAVWWRKAPPTSRVGPASITSFFHPLDAVRDWNRVYGPSGFVQWQCVVPDRDTLAELCARFGRLPAYLAVLKRFGAANAAPLSFPQPGWTLAVDLPATDRVLAELHELDRVTADAGGRVYLAKDARMSRSHFEAMYPRLDEWRSIRRSVDPRRRFRSDLGDRLGLS